MASWIGTIYASPTLVAAGPTASGWVDIKSLFDRVSVEANQESIAIKQATLRLVPENLATDETLDLDMNVAWDAAGSGDLKLHDFTQVTSSNAAETLVLPGGDSEAASYVVVPSTLEVGTAADEYKPVTKFDMLLPPFWQFTATVGGTTKSMNYTVYATLIW